VPVLRYDVELTSSGYLYLTAALASARFPNDAVLATVEAGNLILWPTSGASTGGLLLKQRNPAGDRCVLISEVIPPDTPPGMKQALWDENRFRLTVELMAASAVGCNTLIEQENGRWVVYLEVGFWEAGGETPISVTRSRINDYASLRDAEVAASWIQRSSDRNVTRPAEGG